MAFIPNPNIIKQGDRVVSVEEISIFAGTFTIGHEFTVTAIGERGYDLIDDEGFCVIEVFNSKVKKLIKPECAWR